MAQLPERLFKLSGSEVYLNATLVYVDTGSKRRYRLLVAQELSPQSEWLEVDSIILATAFTNGARPVHAHTTVFRSSVRLSLKYFTDRKDLSSVLKRIFTNSPDIKVLGILSIREAETCYYPEEWGCDDFECNQCEVNCIYTITSTQQIKDDEISQMLGLMTGR